jgi:hypothetical protein
MKAKDIVEPCSTSPWSAPPVVVPLRQPMVGRDSLRMRLSNIVTTVKIEADTLSQAWEDMSIILNKADQSFRKATDWLYKAVGGKMSTADNGKTWNFTTLSIPETKF